MNEIEGHKQKQIDDIVAVVKIFSLLFTSITLFQNVFQNKSIKTIEIYYNIFTIGVVVCILLTIYYLLLFSISRSFKYSHMEYLKFIENIIFFFMFFFTIIISGAHISECKYIFLFIIITTTIQFGMKRGIIVALLSSFTILSIDIYSLPNATINFYFENDLILSGVFILTAWPLGYYVRIEKDHINKLKCLANEDGLTGVYNHRYFQDKLKEQIKLSDVAQNPLSMIFIDIDYFKHYNDLYGHQQGDEVLKGIGELLKKNVRKKDIVARYGGEEFAVILPDTEEKHAITLANVLRILIENTKFYGEENQPNGNLTVSMGVSTYPDKAKSDMDLIKSADDALYKAKFFYKNRVEAYISILDEIKKDIDEEDIELVTSIKTLISVINAKDKYTYGHCERLVFYSRLLAEKLPINKREKDVLVYGAYMHDIGKINVSKEILIKKMPLTDDEWEILKNHPQNGVDIIKPVKSLQEIIPIILHHHEKYNGSGYPSKLKGKEIPYLARVLTVIDSFDAMTSNRPYNKRRTNNEAIKELRRCSGVQFDPQIVEKFIEVIEENKDKLESLNINND
ncbi:bifunctional diguanylate cyclase/phosphohydrolase [Clostridium septicum]|uniref:Diguanylate cyclase n=1 Tax=Clostridium septicum TaxID=1504 RepID=A0A9N7PJS8_CLOSE|nr:diguanylate cyclase [Clostridium septicum]AYE35096.1 diguanylate cyclase [Clostridium septicum]MDU1312687.1 diguanylate cyclase [Clostridium septicum]QAS60489.1 diguanylate cyclase [Clostridium septicum]UEC20253.1 diguanylate cyclase [Clostridium septicum]USS01694.1 diguanylate cyclase [Clostridium septicum]